ncbi:MAG: DUF6175 family protein [Chloroherpetonaceae bacterium]|nr:DUF6175 family protein [Chloroherpetonaceae bacterium]
MPAPLNFFRFRPLNIRSLFTKMLSGLYIVLLSACASTTSSLFFPRPIQAQMPRSTEAVFVEVYDAANVTIRAKGIGKDVDEATADAQKCAVYFMLFKATDRILQTAAEEDAFKGVQDQFFGTEALNASNAIAWTGEEILSRVKMSNGNIRIERLVRINTENLKKFLASLGAVASQSDLTDSQSNPFIMVLPSVAKGESPIDAMAKNPQLKTAATVIESFLTNRRYQVRVPEQQDAVSDLARAVGSVKGVGEDITYQLVLSIGADIYITYSVTVEQGKLGKKAAVTCKAYETTTALLLGSETGYSPERPSVTDAAVIEEAMNDAVGKVLSRVSGYWKEDLDRGRHFKLIFKITGKFNDTFALADAVEEALKGITTQAKQIAATEQTIDFAIRQNNVQTANEFFKELEKKLKTDKTFQGNGAKLRRLQVKDKLILMAIEK